MVIAEMTEERARSIQAPSNSSNVNRVSAADMIIVHSRTPDRPGGRVTVLHGMSAARFSTVRRTLDMEGSWPASGSGSTLEAENFESSSSFLPVSMVTGYGALPRASERRRVHARAAASGGNDGYLGLTHSSFDELHDDEDEAEEEEANRGWVVVTGCEGLPSLERALRDGNGRVLVPDDAWPDLLRERAPDVPCRVFADPLFPEKRRGAGGAASSSSSSSPSSSPLKRAALVGVAAVGALAANLVIRGLAAGAARSGPLVAAAAAHHSSM